MERDYKVLTARIPKKLHKELKIKLAQEETSFQNLMIALLEQYLAGKVKLDKQDD